MATKRMGRPPKSGDETLSVCINLRLTPTELSAYDQVAESSGLDRSEWIRAILNKAAKRPLKNRRQLP